MISRIATTAGRVTRQSLHHQRHRMTSKTTMMPHASYIQQNYFSSAASEHVEEDFSDPHDPIFDGTQRSPSQLVGAKASIRRAFTATSNAAGLLTCGGEPLARHASFDPNYIRAQGWIRHHAVGPAVLSPVLISGLVGALVEAAFPHSVPVGHSIQHKRPLIVGVEVCAKLEVTSVEEKAKEVASPNPDLSPSHKDDGYQVQLETKVVRVRDDEIIACGTHTVWIPDYLQQTKC
jgi:acyl dehydratase